ncbi:hypothetical protein MLD38_013586 [Melastoma candidum]|uniref:Uncharacterized protein n=1 Tax=Melastoma candidum TaxID=119954 RepID=A0ACB9RA53_9MYRT|nr:hypothetical protein MLD38_013586 [Melastoma candidum]
MRFKMQFEGVEGPKRRFSGTTFGIEEGRSSAWTDSEWRCLKVRWDESSSIMRADRVSPWEIEPFVAEAAFNSQPGQRIRRQRQSSFPSGSDLSIPVGK